MFTVVADTHLGETNEYRLQQLTQLIQDTNEPIVWLGDAFDTLRHNDAYKQYGYLMRDKDIWISGNHDYAQSQTRSLWIGKTFLTHGDAVDFGLMAARLQGIREGTVRNDTVRPLERVLSKLRHWTLDDMYNLYLVLYSLSDKDVRAFEHSHSGYTVRNIISYIRVLGKLLITPTSIPTVLKDIPIPDGEKVMGYVTHDPMKLLKLALYFYPEAKLADTIIVGHTHHPIDETLTLDGKTYRFITLGAWIGDVTPTYAQIKEDAITITQI